MRNVGRAGPTVGAREVVDEGEWSWTSQTKPGPNMPRAVERRVDLKVGREENEAWRALESSAGIGVVVGDCGARSVGLWKVCGT